MEPLSQEQHKIWYRIIHEAVERLTHVQKEYSTAPHLEEELTVTVQGLMQRSREVAQKVSGLKEFIESDLTTHPPWVTMAIRGTPIQAVPASVLVPSNSAANLQPREILPTAATILQPSAMLPNGRPPYPNHEGTPGRLPHPNAQWGSSSPPARSLSPVVDRTQFAHGMTQFGGSAALPVRNGGGSASFPTQRLEHSMSGPVGSASTSSTGRRGLLMSNVPLPTGTM